MNGLRHAKHLHSLPPFRNFRSFAAAILHLILSATATFAQAPAAEPRPVITVLGTVRDAVGNPVSDASVFFEEKATAALAETKTKTDGTFFFLALRAGTYTVRAEKAGMRASAVASLLLSIGERKRIDLVLESSPAKESPSPNAKKSGSASAAMQFDDSPSFTVAGVTDCLAGDRAEHSGDSLAAVREYEQAVRLDPSEQNYFTWGTELLLHRAIKPAVEVFTKGSVAHPKSARMLAGLGAALYAGGSYSDAARRVCEASDLQPADPTPYLFLGQMEKAAPDPLPCVVEKLARFTHDQPANAMGSYYYAVALWKQSRGLENSSALQQVEALLQKAITADSQLDEAHIQLGVLYSARGNFPEAINAYKKAIEVNPQSGEAHYRLALAYKRVGEDEQSEQELQLYKQADKTEAATIEQQRREIRQFLIILKDQPQATPPQPR